VLGPICIGRLLDTDLRPFDMSAYENCSAQPAELPFRSELIGNIMRFYKLRACSAETADVTTLNIKNRMFNSMLIRFCAIFFFFRYSVVLVGTVLGFVVADAN